MGKQKGKRKHGKNKKSQGPSIDKVLAWIRKNIGLVITALPLVGAVLHVIIQFMIDSYARGRGYYFGLPKEYLIINYGSTIYTAIFAVAIFMAYILFILWIVWDCKTTQRSSFRKLKFLCYLLLPPLVFLAATILGNVIIMRQEPKESIQLLIVIFTVHVTMIFAFGVCILRPLRIALIEQGDVEEKPILTREEKEEQLKKEKLRDKGGKIMGVFIIVVTICALVFYFHYLGKSHAEEQREFLYASLENTKYVVVMSDGNEALLEKCEWTDKKGGQKGTILTIYTDEFMKIDCNNLLLEKKIFNQVNIESLEGEK